MTRIKKSRKAGSIINSKTVKTPKVSNHVETKAHGKGHKPGSRNSITALKPEQANSNQPKDKRLGSKKPISLVVNEAETNIPKTQPKAKLVNENKAPDQTEKWTLELDQLEQDEKLADLLSRFDDGETLNANEMAELNKKTDRHAWLLEKLGLAEEELSEEDALLAEFENAKLDKGDFE